MKFIFLKNPILIFSIGIFVLYFLPAVANEFWVVQIASRTLILGLIALGLTFLAGRGGMVSLAQMTIAGISGYVYAIFGVSSSGLHLPGIPIILLSLFVSTLIGVLIGCISVRTQGIYTIMITLAFATCFFYLARQNYVIFNGFNGFAEILPPDSFAFLINETKTGVDPTNFYRLCLFLAAGFLALIMFLEKTSFGLALQASGSNPLKLRSLGQNVNLIKIIAYGIASLTAAFGGILWCWWNTRISPSAINVDAAIVILIITILGGVNYPLGAFLGTFLYVLLENFAIDLVSANLFNALTGFIFILVLMFSKDGIYGLFLKFFSPFRKVIQKIAFLKV